MQNIIFKCKVGSHAYGTNIEGSDEDFKGVFIQDPLDLLNNGYKEQVNINKDETYYEIRRFLELCCTGNPTMLELLYSPPDCIILKDKIFDYIIDNRDKMLSKSCRYSYCGYAYEQIKKAGGLSKKMNWEKDKTIRRTVLDFCYIYDFKNDNCKVISLRKWLEKEGFKQENCGLTTLPHLRYSYNLYYDHIKDLKSDNPKFKDQTDIIYNGVVSDDNIANDVCLSEIPEYYAGRMCEAMLYFNKDEYSKHCGEYRDYTNWLEKRNIQRYVDVENHGQKIDGKNLLHCYRLIETGIELAKLGTVNVRRSNAQFLIDIRKGKYNLEELLSKAKDKIKELNKAYDECSLPEKADRGFFMSLMVKMRKEYYGRNKEITKEND